MLFISVIAAVFDMTDEETLHEIPKWLNDALEVNTNEPLIFLIGTKLDLLVRAFMTALSGS